MKAKLSIAIVALSLAACSSVKLNPEQTLSTKFVNDRIKIETKCSFFSKDDCEVFAIESTGTFNVVTNATLSSEQATRAAQIKAKDNLNKFLSEKITSSSVQNTLAKTVSCGSEKLKTGIDGKPVEVTDQEPSNGSTTDSSNDVAIQLTETINTQASSILKGFSVVKIEDEKSQSGKLISVSVTIRWDKNNDKAIKALRSSGTYSLLQ